MRASKRVDSTEKTASKLKNKDCGHSHAIQSVLVAAAVMSIAFGEDVDT